MEDTQPRLLAELPEIEEIKKSVCTILDNNAQPSAWELLKILEQKLGSKVRWVVADALSLLTGDKKLTNAQRRYIIDLLESDDWHNAIRGSVNPGNEVQSTIDTLFQESKYYRTSAAFQEMISFMANFREYAPFNNMLVKLQKPSCSYYATKNNWVDRFKRNLIEDACPMLILAPMHPVMLVYDLDSTVGPPLPKHLQDFSMFKGELEPKRLSLTEQNATTHDLIRIDTVTLSSTNAGFATMSRGVPGMKMRIALDSKLDSTSRYGVLLHELAHIYLGHLGGDKDNWWPSRGNLDRRAMEVEAEATAYIVSRRAGLQNSSNQYVSGYLNNDDILGKVSIDLIAKVAGRLENMGSHTLGKRRDKRAVPAVLKQKKRDLHATKTDEAKNGQVSLF